MINLSIARRLCLKESRHLYNCNRSIGKMTTESKPKVFVTRHPRNIPDKAKAILAEYCEVSYWTTDEPPPRPEFLAAVKGIEGLFCLLTEKIDVELLDTAGSSLKVVSTMSVGYDHIDVMECKSRGIKIGFTPEVLTNATAELTVAILLATSRRLKEAMYAAMNGIWGPWKPLWMTGPGLDGATVGIVGMGRIGTTVACYLKPFGVEQILYSGNSEKVHASDMGAKFVTFDELLEKSDFVIVCCALTLETKHLFNKSAFKKMKKTAIFVNSSRGGVVNQDDLIEALKSGEIGGAGLDVTTPEPLPVSSPLFHLPNCLVIPHIGSATHASRGAMAILAANNLIAGLKNKKLLNEV